MRGPRRSSRPINRSLGVLVAILICGALVAAVALASAVNPHVVRASQFDAAVSPTAVPSCPTGNATDVWQGGSPGAWETSGNWSAGSPGSSSYVCIPSGATVDLNSTDTIAGLLLESGATLDIQSGGLTVSGISAPDSALQGALQVDASASFTVGSSGTLLNAAGGAITNLGAVQVSCDFEQDAGTVAAGGDKPVQLANGSSLVFAGTGAGAFQVSDATATTIGVSLSGNISAGQSLEIQSPQGGNNDPRTTVTATGSFTNAGTITFAYAASAGGYQDSSELTLPSGDTLTNTGTIQTVGSPDGSHPGEWNETIDGNVDNQGTVNVGESGDPYSVLVLAPGSTLTNDGGTINVLSAANANANNNGPSDLFISAATTGVGAEPAAELVNSSGTINDQGTVEVKGAFSQGAGTLATAGGDNPIELNDGSSIAFTGSGPGAFQVTDANANTIGVALSGNISAGQSLEIQSPQGGNNDPLTTVTAAGSFTNAGTIMLDYAPSATGYEDSSRLALPSGDTLTNTGTIKVAGSPDGSHVGEWDDTIDGNLANYGILDVGLSGDPYAVLVLAPGSTLTNDGGTINVLSAAHANANNNGPSDLFISAATSGVGAEPAAELVNSSGTINDQGTVQVKGAFSQGAGTVSTAAGDNPIELNDGSSIAFTGSGPGAFQVTDANANTIGVALSGNISAGQSLEIQSPQGGNNDPLTTVTAAGSFTNAGTITLDHAGGEDSVELALPAAHTLTNTGTIRVAGSPDTSYSNQWNETLDANVANDGILDVGITGQPGAYLVIPTGIELTNTGTINVLGASSSSDNDASKLGADDGLLQSAGTTNLAAGTVLDVSQSASGFSVSGGALTGAGQVTGNVDQTGGTIAPGTSGTPGTLTISGNFTEGSSATLAIPIDGTASGDYSVLAVGDNATLSGGLSLQPSSSYQSSAQLGDSDPVFTYGGTLTGSFTSAVVAPQNTVLPQVTGSTSVGDTLQCVSGTFTDSPTNLTYQWDRNGTAIAAATSSAYQVQSVDLGTTISCSQTAGGGSALSGGRGFNAVVDAGASAIDAVVGSTYAAGSTTAFSAGVLVPEPTTSIAAVTIPTSTVPAASDHGAYGTALTACGGTAPSCEVYSPSAGTLVDSLDNPVSTGDQFTFAKTSGSLPPGITLSSQGYLFGTPTQSGSYQFTVVATDPNQNSSSPYTYTLTVNPAAAVTISPATLPAAVGANAYSASLTACGGTAPSCETYSSSAGTMVNPSGSTVAGSQQFRFTTVSGSLPPGITLSSQGYVSGTPTQSGAYQFTVVATDPNQDASNAYSYTLTVNPGIAITAGSFHLAGALPAGAASVTLGSSGGINAVIIAGSGASSLATITGAGVPANVNQIGLQIGHDQSGDCLTELELEGPGGVVFNAANLDISGCDSAAAASATALLRSGAVRGRSAEARQALGSAAGFEGRVRTTVRVPASSVSSVIAPASPVLTTAADASDCSYSSELANIAVTNATCTETGSGSFVIHISGSSPISGSVSGGTYTAELNGSQQSSSVQLTPVVAAAPSFPPILPVTPITRLVDSQASPLGSSSASQSLMASYGFPSGTTAEQVLPSFASSTGASAQAVSALAALESEAASLNSSNRGSLVSALSSELADGLSDSSLPFFDDPLGSGTLQAAGTSQFASGVSSFSSSYGTTIPSLAPAGSTIKAAVPVSPIAPVAVPIAVAPTPVGSITKIGTGAFTETVTAASPTVRTAPFPTTGATSFTIEVVGQA